MREIYIIKNSIMPHYMIQDGENENKRKNFPELEGILKYFNTDNEGVKLKMRKNLKIFVDTYNNDEKEKVLDVLSKINFKKSIIAFKNYN